MTDHATRLVPVVPYTSQVRNSPAGSHVFHHHGGGQWISQFQRSGGPATSASLNYPTGAAVDSAGSLYIADFVNNRIRIRNISATINTLSQVTESRL
jgi:hypothetical protein